MAAEYAQVNQELANTIVEPTEDASVQEDTSDFGGDQASSDDSISDGDTLVAVDEVEAEVLSDSMEALGHYASLLRKAGPEGISRQTAAFMRVGIEHLDVITGYQETTSGLEAFTTATPRDGRIKTVISQESLMDRAKDAGKKLWAMILAAFDKAKQLWEKYFGTRKKAEAKGKYLLTCIPQFPGYPGGQFKGDIPAPPGGVSSPLPAVVKEAVASKSEEREPKTSVTVKSPSLLFFKDNRPLVNPIVYKAPLDYFYGEYTKAVVSYVRELALAVKAAVAKKSVSGLSEKMDELSQRIFAPAYRVEFNLGGGKTFKVNHETGQFEFMENGDVVTEDREFEIRAREKLKAVVDGIVKLCARSDSYADALKEATRAELDKMSQYIDGLWDLEDADPEEVAALGQKISKSTRDAMALFPITQLEHQVDMCLLAQMSLAEAEMAAYF